MGRYPRHRFQAYSERVQAFRPLRNLFALFWVILAGALVVGWLVFVRSMVGWPRIVGRSAGLPSRLHGIPVVLFGAMALSRAETPAHFLSDRTVSAVTPFAVLGDTVVSDSSWGAPTPVVLDCSSPRSPYRRIVNTASASMGPSPCSPTSAGDLAAAGPGVPGGDRACRAPQALEWPITGRDDVRKPLVPALCDCRPVRDLLAHVPGPAPPLFPRGRGDNAVRVCGELGSACWVAGSRYSHSNAHSVAPGAVARQ